MKKISFFFIFPLLLLSCEKGDFPDPATLSKGLAGSWVETHTLEDTIVFNSDRDTGYFYLSRGYEMRNGYWLPKIGSAPYSYIISEGSITVIDGLSSSLQGGTYYFRYNETDLTISIGKFCKYIDTKRSTLIFRKIR